MYIEIRKTLKRRHDPILVPNGSLPPGYNFRSVYCYNQKTKEYIEQQKSTKHLRGVELYSDMLFIDVDGSDEDVQFVGNQLLDLGVCFQYWTTGNRGAHFHVPIEPMTSVFVPQSQSYWIRHHLDYNKIDISIYNSNGQIRLPGAIHQKTGKVKRLQEFIDGNKLQIPIIKTCIVKPSKNVMPATRSSYIYNLTRHKSSGKRHMHLMIIVKEGISLNYSLDHITKDCLWWNLYFTDFPLDDILVVEHVEKTYTHNIGSSYEA